MVRVTNYRSSFQKQISGKNSINMTGGPAATAASAGIDKYMTFYHIMPFVLFFVVIIWMIVVALRKEEVNY